MVKFSVLGVHTPTGLAPSYSGPAFSDKPTTKPPLIMAKPSSELLIVETSMPAFMLSATLKLVKVTCPMPYAMAPSLLFL